MKLEELKKEAVEEFDKLEITVRGNGENYGSEQEKVYQATVDYVWEQMKPKVRDYLLTYIDKASKCIELPEEKEPLENDKLGQWGIDGYNQCLNDIKKLNNIK